MTWQMRASVSAKNIMLAVEGSVSFGIYFGIRLPCHPMFIDSHAFYNESRFFLQVARGRMRSKYSRVQVLHWQLVSIHCSEQPLGAGKQKCGRSKVCARTPSFGPVLARASVTEAERVERQTKPSDAVPITLPHLTETTSRNPTTHVAHC